jgi:transposase
MGRAIAVKTDYSGAEVRRLAKRTKDAAQARRLLAVAAILDGASREEAAKTGGMDRQTLRDWVIRFNEQGPDGLINIASPGAPAKLDEEHKAFLARIVDEGPTPAIHGVVRWRACDLIMRLYEEFALSVSDDTIYRAMKELGFSHVSARPKAYKQDAEAIDAFKKRMARPVASGFFECAMIGLLQRIRPRTKPRPRWRYARPGPHKHRGVGRRFFDQVSRTPFDCQAISFPPLANTVSSSAPQVRRSAAD